MYKSALVVIQKYRGNIKMQSNKSHCVLVQEQVQVTDPVFVPGLPNESLGQVRMGTWKPKAVRAAAQLPGLQSALGNYR